MVRADGVGLDAAPPVVGSEGTLHRPLTEYVGDLAELSRHFLQFFKAGVRYPQSRVVVRVVP